MKIKKNKTILSTIAALLCITSITGCNKQETTNSDQLELKWWAVNYAQAYIPSYNDVQAYKEIGKKVGVNINFVNVNVESAAEQFNLLAASGDLPDIVDYNFANYSGGSAKAIEDNLIIDLTPYINAEKTPNLWQRIEENDMYRRALKNYNNTISVFPSLRDDDSINVSYGPTFRQDWLDELGLSVPQTIGDWYNVLTAFKTQDPNKNGIADEIPLAADKDVFFGYLAAAYGVTFKFCKNTDGEIVYGPIQPEFKAYLEEMNKWYREGLIDSEFASLSRTNIDSKVTNDISGAFVGYIGSQLGNYMNARGKDGSGFKLVGAPWPSLDNNSAQYTPSHEILDLATSGSGCAITTTNKNVDKTVELLDYCYSQEGYDLLNWGIEGTTYTKENGTYKYTDFILNNDEGKDPVAALAPYCLPIYGSGAKIMSADAYDAVGRAIDEQREASKVWADCDKSLCMPVLTYTTDESEIISDTMGDIDTYFNEMFVKFVMGVEPLSNFDSYVEQLEKMGVDKVVKVYRDAYERYMQN